MFDFCLLHSFALEWQREHHCCDLKFTYFFDLHNQQVRCNRNTVNVKVRKNYGNKCAEASLCVEGVGVNDCKKLLCASLCECLFRLFA